MLIEQDDVEIHALAARDWSVSAISTGEAKTTVLRLTGEAGELVKQSARETRRLATRLRDRAHGRGARGKLAAARRLEESADRAEQIARQIDQRLAGRRVPVEPHRAAGDLVLPVAEAVRHGCSSGMPNVLPRAR